MKFLNDSFPFLQYLCLVINIKLNEDKNQDIIFHWHLF